ncbi:myb-like protein X isoform X5 [Medicago truncatula]|uniref:myb-like protein X isoform X3 n=1 Tax=Medicago truncatula TaxID=3880 RepID=UPI00196813DD|nr:myb-like protein X isoform X3 [Medicago truncatula]XP_039687514.1 myb-like protein X isoform X5 [Medicago truncatula]
MSRCFPFPPPGYEKKSRTDDVDLLKKERRKEKKHKKEKKDKEKKESKENGEKEGRDGKHKDKKDKKEKSREKKKDKDKDKDNGKDKSKISAADGRGSPAQAQGLNAGNLHQKEIKQNDKKAFLFEDRLTKQHGSNNGEKARENNHLAEENKDSKFLMELDRRVRNNDGGAGTQLVQQSTTADCRKDEGTVRLVAKISGTGTWPDGKEKLQNKGVDAKKIDGRGIRAEARPIGNATVQNHAVDGKKIGTWPNGKEKFQDKGVDAKKIDGRGICTEARPIGNAAVQNHAGNCHPRPLEKNFDKTLEGRVEGTDRTKEEKDDKRRDKRKDDKRGDKRKEKDKEKKGHGKDKDRDKEKKKEEKAKQKIENRNGEQNKLKDSNKAGLVDPNSSTQVSKNSHENSIIGVNLKKRNEIDSNGVLHAHENSITRGNLKKWKEIDSNGVLHAHENSITGGNLKKRKEIDSNGVLHAHENSIIGDNLKKQKEIESNGVLHANENSIIGDNLTKRKEINSNGVLHAHGNSIIGDNLKKRKEIDSNGVLHAHDSRPSMLPGPSSSHPFTENGRILEPCQISPINASDGPAAATNVKVENKDRKINGIIEVPTSVVSPNKIPTATVPANPVIKVPKPHPDTKYISQVYSVPKANEWSDFDDQEWLFGSNHSQERKPVVKSSEVVDTLQVWAEAVHIEPADVFALPYVIPY